jgi:hypothetical protein
LTGATVGIHLDEGGGNNQYSLLYRGTVTNSNILVTQFGGNGADAANIFYQPEASFIHSQAGVYFSGRGGNDGFNSSNNAARITDGAFMVNAVEMGDGIDVLNYRLNSAIADAGSTGTAALYAALGNGDDTFTSTLGYDAGLIRAGSLAVFQVDGGADNDLFFVAPVTFFDHDLVLQGDIRYYLGGGSGNDSITFATLDILGGSNRALTLGATSNFVVQIDAGEGNDKIELFLNLFATDPGLANRASIFVAGSAGNDRVNLIGVGSTTAPNLGFVYIDGGTGINTYSETLLIPFNRTVVNFQL